MTAATDQREPDEAEIDGLMAELHHSTGHDFRGYARGSRRRRLKAFLCREGLSSIAELGRLLRADPTAAQRLVRTMSVAATAMFRDPPVHAALRRLVLPHLATYPSVRVWVAGCASGEEAWSMAILLHEAGLARRSRIYATDLDPQLIERARAGIFPLAAMRDHTRSYLAAGGRRDFAGYYTAAHGRARFDPGLAGNLLFAQHNLATDGVFNEFQLILCRNVLLYFDHALRHRAVELFRASLPHLGVLCLGAHERLDPEDAAAGFTVLDEAARLYRRVGDPAGQEAP